MALLLKRAGDEWRTSIPLGEPTEIPEELAYLMFGNAIYQILGGGEKYLPLHDIGLNEWSEYIANWRERKEFITPDELCDEMGLKLLRIHEEVSEASEALRDMDKDGFVEEIIDIIVRCCDILGTLRHAKTTTVLMVEKMAKNEKRPPRHGRKSPY